MSRRCKCCGRRIPYRPQNPDQEYCYRRVCQNERRRRWRRAKLRSDAEYRANQADSHKRWAAANPDYYRKWRARHPEYVARNRRLQKGRDRLRKDLAAIDRKGAVLANSDASAGEKIKISVVYELLPAQSADLAKRYASKRYFHLIPITCSDFVAESGSCKEITRETLPFSSGTARPCPEPSS